MIVFVDASALAAIVRGEPDHLGLRTALDGFNTRLTSGLAVWETARAVQGGITEDMRAALLEVERFCLALEIDIVPIGAAEAAEAVSAHVRYGKGTGHPARLNMGDCFAYACARTNGAKLLYKGDDFGQTDLA